MPRIINTCSNSLFYNHDLTQSSVDAISEMDNTFSARLKHGTNRRSRTSASQLTIVSTCVVSECYRSLGVKIFGVIISQLKLHILLLNVAPQILTMHFLHVLFPGDFSDVWRSRSSLTMAAECKFTESLEPHNFLIRMESQ